MGLSILTDSEDTEAVIVNDSVLPPQPIPFVFYKDYEPGIYELVNEFLDWVKDIRGLAKNPNITWAKAIEAKWTEFLKEGEDA